MVDSIFVIINILNTCIFCKFINNRKNLLVVVIVVVVVVVVAVVVVVVVVVVVIVVVLYNPPLTAEFLCRLPEFSSSIQRFLTFLLTAHLEFFLHRKSFYVSMYVFQIFRSSTTTA